MPERSFGRTVRYRRTKLGLSQAKLGELVGRSPATIRSWERDERYPTETKVITALSAILGVDERAMYEKAGLSPPEVEESPTVEQALATLAPQQDAAPDVKPAPTPITGQVELELRPLSEPGYRAPAEQYIVTRAAPPIAEPSYLEDKGERQAYRVRHLATLVVAVALVIALLWALAQGVESFGQWWDDFFGTLRL